MKNLKIVRYKLNFAQICQGSNLPHIERFTQKVQNWLNLTKNLRSLVEFNQKLSNAPVKLTKMEIISKDTYK